MLASAGSIVRSRSATCGAACQADPCTLRRIRYAERELDAEPVLVVWAELSVVAHLIGEPMPVLTTDMLDALARFGARHRECTLSHAVDAAVAVRTFAFATQLSPDELAVHVNRAMNACVSGSDAADDDCDWSRWQISSARGRPTGDWFCTAQTPPPGWRRPSDAGPKSRTGRAGWLGPWTISSLIAGQPGFSEVAGNDTRPFPARGRRTDRLRTRLHRELGAEGWSRSVEERNRDHAEERQKVRDHLAERPRTLYSRPTTDRGDSMPRGTPDRAEEEPDEPDEPSETDRRVDELRIEGHGPQRHLDPSNDQLKDRLGTPEVGPDGKPVLKPNGEVRSHDRIDPMTGSTVDGVHGRPHRCGDVATAFSSPNDYVAAEAYFRAKVTSDGRRQSDATIEEVLGKDAEERMRGFRHDRETAGRYTEVDFTGGSINAVYKWADNGDLLSTTLYPMPAPDKQSKGDTDGQ